MDSDFQDDLLQSYSETELIRHILASPSLVPISSIHLLSKNLLAKHYEASLVDDALKAMDTAHRLGIRVPCVKRTIRSGHNVWCIMERILGDTLEIVWSQLSWFATIKLSLQLRHFVRCLRSLTSSTAGSLATGQCRSFYLEDRFGLPARSNPKDITYFIRFWVGFSSIRQAIKAATQASVEPRGRIPPTAKSLVFTHHDLAPRNLLLDPSGQLWLLDWDLAGFYPIYFEYASMQNFQMPRDWNLLSKLRWDLFTRAAVGRYSQDARVLEQIRSRFSRFAVGRRFDLLQNGGPSGRPVS